MSNKLRYPDIKVQLTGIDGNAHAIIGAVRNALRSNNVPAIEIGTFQHEALSGDYNHLLQTCMDWVNVT